MVIIKHILRALTVFLFMLCIPAQGQAADINASVDRSIVHDGESLQLDLEASSSVDNDPEFAPLEKDFDILSRNKSTSMQIINGQISRKTRWSLMLMPKRSGTLRIPAITFGKDKSNPVTISVKSGQSSQPSSAADDVFIQVSATPQRSYVQAEILYTVRIFLAVNMNNASLSEPGLSDADAVIEKLGDDRQYQTNHQGRRYQVYERQYAIYPQRSGKLRIEPVVFNAQLVNNSRYMFSPFSQQGQTRRLRSKAIDIDVKPIPAQYKSKHWLPARKLSLQEQWPTEPPKFKVGEAVTRTLTLRAEGLTAAQLPEIDEGAGNDFKTYPDQASLDDQKQDKGIIGTRTEKIAMIASHAGEYTLPEITINWWNSQTNRSETARLPARKITVLAGDGSRQPTITAKPQDKQAQKTALPSPADTATSSSASPRDSGNGFWPWLSLVLALGWLGTLVLMWTRRHRQTIATAEQLTEDTMAKQLSVKQVEKNIRRACLANDGHACKEALLAWARLHYPQDNPSSLGDLTKYLNNELAGHIATLNKTLYSQSTESWQGNTLWTAWDKTDNKNNQTKKDQRSVLAPLYP